MSSDPHVLWMNGIDCGKCFRPAAAHDFLIGVTHHVSPHAPFCQIHEPRPHLNNGGDPCPQ